VPHFTPFSQRRRNDKIQFQLRFSPALASKPKAPARPEGPGTKPFNPFENPASALLVAQLPPAHTLVLNKFSVVPEHFLLITKEVKPQTHILEVDDLEATYACIQAYQAEGQELFAYFNSGEHSGASQPHRHVQLLSIERMRDGLENVESGHSWKVLIDTSSSQELPFTILKANHDPEMSAEARHELYLSLYKRAVVLSGAGKEGEVPSTGPAKISYNLAMTRTSMALCPRTSEGALIREPTGQEAGAVSLNGTVLGGTALVKNQAEWDVLRKDPGLLLTVLKGIGIPPDNSLSGSL
jgi:sulfate adenylyltransferase (ADP) / ATP adenylyltransferase